METKVRDSLSEGSVSQSDPRHPLTVHVLLLPSSLPDRPHVWFPSQLQSGRVLRRSKTWTNYGSQRTGWGNTALKYNSRTQSTGLTGTHQSPLHHPLQPVVYVPAWTDHQPDGGMERRGREGLRWGGC